MSAQALAEPMQAGLHGLLTKASDDIGFRSFLKYDPDGALAGFDFSPELKSVLSSRQYLSVRSALYGQGLRLNAETVVAVAVAVYTATAVAVA
jgi:hypothetical protein